MPPQKPATPKPRIVKPAVDPPAETLQTDNDRIEIGGMMRCCSETISDLYPDGPGRVATEGQTLQCKYVPDRDTHRVIFRDGYWRWDRTEPDPLKG